MKTKNLQNVVLSKYQNDDTPTKIYHNFSGAIGLRTIKRWYQMIHQISAISLSSPPGCPRLVRTKANIKKVNNRLRRKSRMSELRSSIFLELVSGEY